MCLGPDLYVCLSFVCLDSTRFRGTTRPVTIGCLSQSDFASILESAWEILVLCVKCEYIGGHLCAGRTVTTWNAVVHTVKAGGPLGFCKMPLLLLCHCWPKKYLDLRGYWGKHSRLSHGISKRLIQIRLKSMVLKTYKGTAAMRETLTLMIWIYSLEEVTYKYEKGREDFIPPIFLSTPNLPQARYMLPGDQGTIFISTTHQSM